MKSWFLISELRAANIPTFTEEFFRELENAHLDLARDQVRKCMPLAKTIGVGVAGFLDPIFFTGAAAYRPEFHIGLFMRAERRQLFTVYRAELDRE